MCKYCARIKDENEDLEFFADEKVDTDYGLTITALDATLTDMNGPKMWITTYLGDKNDELIDIHVPIHYCPFCGEKLD